MRVYTALYSSEALRCNRRLLTVSVLPKIITYGICVTNVGFRINCYVYVILFVNFATQIANNFRLHRTMANIIKLHSFDENLFIKAFGLFDWLFVHCLWLPWKSIASIAP